jgi:hypothetical protein
MIFQLYRNEKLIEVEVTCYEKVPTKDSDIRFDENKESGLVDGEGNVKGFDDFEDEDAFSFFCRRDWRTSSLAAVGNTAPT